LVSTPESNIPGISFPPGKPGVAGVGAPDCLLIALKHLAQRSEHLHLHLHDAVAPGAKAGACHVMTGFGMTGASCAGNRQVEWLLVLLQAAR
jgi:hypothetical protein